MASKTIIGNLTTILSKGKFTADLGSPSYGSPYSKIMEALLAARVSLRESAEKYISLLNIFSVNPDIISGRTNFQDIINYPESFRGDQETGALFLEQIDNFESWFESFGISHPVDGTLGYRLQMSTADGKCVNLFYCIGAGSLARGVYSYYIDHYVYTIMQPIVNVTREGEVRAGELLYDSIGRPLYLGDVLSGLMENSSLVEALQQLSDTLTMTKVDASTVLGNVNSFLTSKYQSVRDLGPQVISAWKSGGVYGVAMLIVNYFQAISTTHANDDGDLEFTDNSKLVPQVYISGIISSIGTTVATLVSAVLASVSKVMAILVGVAGQVFNAFFGKLKYDYENETYASFVNTVDVQISAAPLAMGQDADQSTLTSYPEDIQAAINPLNCVKVPGGYVIFTVTDNGTTYEFHPDLVPRLASVRALMQGKCNMSQASSDFSLDDTSITIDQLYSISGDDAETTELIADNSASGVVSADVDEKIRGIILVNTFIYLLFCRAYQRKVKTFKHSTVTEWSFNTNGLAVWMDYTLNEKQTRYLEFLAMGVGRVVNNSYGPVKPSAAIGSANSWGSIAESFNQWAVDDTYIQDYEAIPVSSSRTLLLTNDFELDYILKNRLFCGPIVALDSGLSYAVKLPRYDRSSFWVGIAISAVIGITAAVATVVVSAKVAKKIRATKLKNTAAVEAAYTNVSNNPGDPAAMKEYQKAVTKNNVFASVFGGTKYSKTGRWDSTDNTGAEAVSELLTAESVNTGQQDVASTGSINDVILLIRGPLSETPSNN